MVLEVEARGCDQWGYPRQVRIPGRIKRWLYPTGRGGVCYTTAVDADGWHTLPARSDAEYQIEAQGDLEEARHYRFTFSPHWSTTGSSGAPTRGSFYGSP